MSQRINPPHDTDRLCSSPIRHIIVFSPTYRGCMSSERWNWTNPLTICSSRTSAKVGWRYFHESTPQMWAIAFGSQTTVNCVNNGPGMEYTPPKSFAQPAYNCPGSLDSITAFITPNARCAGGGPRRDFLSRDGFKHERKR